MKQAEFDSFFKIYSDRLLEFEALKDEGMRTLREAITRSGIKVHSIPARIKGFDSCINKVIDKRIEEPFEGIKDFVGLRVVCLFRSDLDRVENAIEQAFEVVEREYKTKNSKEDVFGYMGDHFIVKLKAEKKTNTMPFEIQVRTIAMDAWDSVSHHLDYKQANSIPHELRRDFYALSGLFYVADTHFSILKHDEI